VHQSSSGIGPAARSYSTRLDDRSMTGPSSRMIADNHIRNAAGGVDPSRPGAGLGRRGRSGFLDAGAGKFGLERLGHSRPHCCSAAPQT
jgi:hypothetical protein